MKLQIKNYTNYKTQDIRKLLLACIKKDGININWLKVEVKYQRGWCAGRSSYNGNWMMIALMNSNKYNSQIKKLKKRLEKATTESNKKFYATYIEKCQKYQGQLSDPKKIAQVIFHELQHLKGLHHEDMLPDDNWDVSWVDGGYPLRLNEEKPKPKGILSKKDTRKIMGLMR